MNQQISVTAPITSLIGDLQDISSSLAAANPPAKTGLRDYQLAAIDDVRAVSNQAKRAEALGRAAIRCITLNELDNLLAPLIAAGVMRTHYERITGATEYRDQMGKLWALSVGGSHFCRTGTIGDVFDKLAAYISGNPDAWQPHQWVHGGAGEGASLPVVMTLPAPGQSSTEGLYIQQIGRVPRPTTSLALHLQTAGRVKRQSPPVHAYLENPMTGEKIEGSDFTIGGDK